MGGGRAEWMKRIASMPAPQMPVEKLKRWGEELKKGVWGCWENHQWVPLRISARQRAKLKKDVLLAGGEWTYDRPRREMRNVMKGHKKDRVAAERRKTTAEIMQKMPQMVEDCRVADGALFLNELLIQVADGAPVPAGTQDTGESVLKRRTRFIRDRECRPIPDSRDELGREGRHQPRTSR